MKNSKATILIVDDMPENIQVLSKILQNKYNIHAAISGQRALDILNIHNDIDLILLDIMMPLMDGYEVCKKIKADPLTANIPVIFVTAKNDIEDEETGFVVGAVDYITKPFNKITIVTRVDTHVRLGQYSHQLAKQVEIELSRRIDTQTKYQYLFESSPIPIFIHPMVNGMPENLEEVNKAAEMLTGYSRQELMSMNPTSLHPKESLSIIPPYAAKVCAGEAVSFEIECVKKDGSIIPVMMFATPFWIDNRQMVYSYFMDLSTIKKMEEEKNLKDRILIQQTKLATMGEMIGAIGHQWRQPLNSLGLSIQDIVYAYSFNELTKEYMTTFKDDTLGTIKYMSQTIDDFRNFFSPNKHEELFLLSDAINQTINLLLVQLKNNGIEVYFDKCNNTQFSYFCNKNELSQVILNILANAKDALIAQKSPNPFIKIELCGDELGYTLTFEDSAKGVPQEIINQIFNPYFTTKQEKGGTGIGLYISKTIIEEHLNGKLTVCNTKNGALFTIWLPKKRDV
jgi:PAS domain S-box-containing protein